MEMMDKMNNLSFQICEEIKEIKENNPDPSNINEDEKKLKPYNTINYYENKKDIITNNSSNDDNLFYLPLKKNKNLIPKYNYNYNNQKDKNFDYSINGIDNFSKAEYLCNKNDMSSNKKNSEIISQNNYNYKYKLNLNYIESNKSHRKKIQSRPSSVNNNEKNNSFTTAKFSNLNNNFLNDVPDDETMISISNEINILHSNLKDHTELNDNGSYKENEILPNFFENKNLFCNFEINNRTIRKLSNDSDTGFFGIKCRDSLKSLRGKYYFNVYLKNTIRSNIYIGITSDPRIGLNGGYHKTQNTFMYSLSNCDAYIRRSNLIGNFMRRGKTGDVYSFLIDFEFTVMKLFLNGNELNHNNIKILPNENCFFPCIDIKDSGDCVSFIDGMLLNFNI